MAKRLRKIVVIVSPLLAVLIIRFFYGNTRNQVCQELGIQSDSKESFFFTSENVVNDNPGKLLSSSSSESFEVMNTYNFSHQNKCNMTHSVVYVRTPKTASTTLLGVLENIMENSHLIPEFPNLMLGGYPGYFNKKFVLHKSHQETEEIKPVALLGHMRFDKKGLQSYMPQDTKYITIIRHPLRQFESTFHFMYGTMSETDGMHGMYRSIPCFGTPFLQILNKFGVGFSQYIDAVVTSLNNSIPFYQRSRNYQSFVLGMNPDITNNETYIKEYVKELDLSFDLVVMNEYFWESLVLLREVLCVDWDLLKFSSIGVRKYKRHNFTFEEERKLKKFLKQDVILYDHMNETFWKKIDKYGRKRMENDVRALKNRIRELTRAQSISEEENSGGKKSKHKSEDIEDIQLMSRNFQRTEKNMATLRRRISENCKEKVGCNMSEKEVHTLADYMADSGGYCPY